MKKSSFTKFIIHNSRDLKNLVIWERLKDLGIYVYKMKGMEKVENIFKYVSH